MKNILFMLALLVSHNLLAQVTAEKLIDLEVGVLVRPMTTDFKNYNFTYILSADDKYVNFKKNRTAPGIYLKINFNLFKDKFFFTYKGNIRYGHLFYDYSKFDTTKVNGILPSVNGIMFDNVLGLKYDFKAKSGIWGLEAGYAFINKRGTEFDYYKKNETGNTFSAYGTNELYDRRVYLGCSYEPIGRVVGTLYAMYGTRSKGQYENIPTLFLELTLGYKILK